VETCRVFRPEKRSSLEEIVASDVEPSYIARGLGRSYGDAALNHRGGVILFERLNRLIAFDPATGVLECEAGVTLAEILELAVPRGYYLPVTPGTKFVTLGGAIANDIHGKNHHRVGTLSNFVLDFRLQTPPGEVITCSPRQNTDAFWATVGGLGLTGLILTKLDGTAKGGVVAAIAKTRPIPLRFIGVGEQVDPLPAVDLWFAVAYPGVPVPTADVFAELTPAHKTRIVAALRKDGHAVGFLGDGVNDVPALRIADAGIAADTAAEVAKYAADLILLDKDLAVVAHGVVEGRRTLANTMKYVKITASSNFGNVLSVLAASALLPFLPILPIQLVVQNLLYDLSQIAIPWDRMDEEFVKRPRQWDARSIASFTLYVGPISSLFDIATFAILWYGFGANTIATQSLFQSGWFVEGLLTQTLIVHTIRTEKIPFLQSTAVWPVVLLTLLIMACGVWLPFSPLAPALRLQALPAAYFPWVAAILVIYCVLTQLLKRFYIQRFGKWL